MTNEKTKDNTAIWIALGIGVAVVVALLLFRRQEPATLAAPVIVDNRPRWVPVKAKHYKNTEITEIEWNADGYPVKITRHRDATQT